METDISGIKVIMLERQKIRAKDRSYLSKQPVIVKMLTDYSDNVKAMQVT